MKTRTAFLTFFSLLIADLVHVHAETLRGRDGEISYALDGILLTRTRNIRPNFSIGGMDGRATKLSLTFTSHEPKPIYAVKAFRLLSATDNTGHSMLPESEFVEIGFREIDDTRLYPVKETPGFSVFNRNPHDLRANLELEYPSSEATSFSMTGEFEYTIDEAAGLLEVNSLRETLNQTLLPENSEWNFVPLVVGELDNGDNVQHVIHIEVRGPYLSGLLSHAKFFDASGQELRPQMQMSGLYMQDISEQGPSAVDAYIQWASAQPQEIWNKPFDEIFKGTPWDNVARPALQYRFPSALPEDIRMVMSVPADAATKRVQFRFEDVTLP